ncbi:MAG: hypothetical protein JRL30_29205, partial [Deltaproteobacteria bacterium]|nr:hypothetical protein [Deltaproteobacteria bacterium]
MKIKQLLKAHICAIVCVTASILGTAAITELSVVTVIVVFTIATVGYAL